MRAPTPYGMNIRLDLEKKIWCCLGSRYLGGLKQYGGAEW